MPDPHSLHSYRPSSRPCPHCGHSLIRVRRSAAERELRDIGTGVPLFRYRCSDADCRWQGLLPQSARGAALAADAAAAEEHRTGAAAGGRRPRRRGGRLATAWRRLRSTGLPWPQLVGMVGVVLLLALAGVQGSRWLQASDTLATATTVGATNGR